jgi:hypothetical protein
MAEFLAPGVFVEEIPNNAHPIEGVPTSTAAILGETERGSIQPSLVTSLVEYARFFGDAFGTDAYVPDAVRGFFDNGGKRLYVCRIVGDAATPAFENFGGFVVRASGPGSWGTRVWAVISDSTMQTVDAAGNAVAVGFRIRLGYWGENQAPFDFVADPARAPRPFVEDFDNLVTDETSPDFYGRHVPYIDRTVDNTRRGPNSSALAILVRDVGAAARPDNGSRVLSQGGDDAGPPGVDDFIGLPAGPRIEPQGLAALESDVFREVALVYAPTVANGVIQAVIAHCDKTRRFAVVDAPKGVTDPLTLDPRVTIPADSRNAAFYYPWLGVIDRQTGARKLVPPGGHALGVYARTDTERGVWHAPAGEVVQSVLDLEIDVDDATQRDLNQRGVNVIRRFADRGIRIWGARTLSSDAQWKYVSVRRFFIFLESSIAQGMGWAVFEPSGPRLWALVAGRIRSFLREQWRQGALSGATEDQAFFVACDETTMTEADMENGRLICEIGIAPLRPAEFVLLTVDARSA